MADRYSSEHIRNSREAAEEYRALVEETNEERRELGVSADSFHGVQSVSPNKPSPTVKKTKVQGACEPPPTSVHYTRTVWL